MNAEKVTAEIAKIVDQYQSSIRYARQHPTSKKHIVRLEELGILQYMPTKFGNGDAQAVIAAAENSVSVDGAINRHNEGETWQNQPSVLCQAMNEVEQPAPRKMRKIRIGDKVRVLTHTTYQHLSHGAVITPDIEHELQGFETTIRNIFKDEMEDENGNSVIEYSYEVETGEVFNEKQIESL